MGPLETAEPDVDGYLIKLDDLSLDEVLQSHDTALGEALRRMLAAGAEATDDVSAFNNFI